MPSFRHDGQRLVYTEYGEGPKVTILLPGLLFSQRIHEALAQTLADRGHRVLTLDLLGHGRSDRPRDMNRYSMQCFAEQTVALMDHLDIDEAVVGGTSLGANVTLSVASHAPERLRGMVVEMPVLDNALLACAIAFTPLMVALTFGEPLMKLVGLGARAIPSSLLPFWGDVVADTIRQEPGPSAAVLQGLFFGRVAPPKAERETFETPALVIGHGRDPIHPFSDSDALVREMANARLVEADSFIEMRLFPERLTEEISGFLDECWKPRRAKPRRQRPGGTRRSSGKRSA